MRVRLLQRWATADFNLAPGTVVEVEADLARSLIAAREAEAVDPLPLVVGVGVETEPADEPESPEPAAPPRPRARKSPRPADPASPVEGE